MRSMYVSGYEYKDISRYGKRSFLGGLQSSSTCDYTLKAGATAVEQFSSYIIHGKTSRVMVARVPTRPDLHVFNTHCLADITGFV